MIEHRTNLRAAVRGDRGAQVVEFALILPVLLIIVMGIINFGYVFGQKLALNQAVREGARDAVVSPTATQADVATMVQSSTGGLIRNPASTVTVTTTIQSGGPTTFGAFDQNGLTCIDYTDVQGMGGQLKVTATHQATWLVPTPFVRITAPRLSSEAVFRCEVI